MYRQEPTIVYIFGISITATENCIHYFDTGKYVVVTIEFSLDIFMIIQGRI